MQAGKYVCSPHMKKLSHTHRTWNTTAHAFLKIACINSCLFHFSWHYRSSKWWAQLLSMKMDKPVCHAVIQYLTTTTTTKKKKKKKRICQKAITWQKRKKTMLKKPFMNFMMKTRLRLWGRKLCPTACSNSNLQNLEVEGQHSRWPTSWDCHKPRNDCQKLWPIYGWLMTDYQAHSHYSRHLTLKCSSHFDPRTGYKENISEMDRSSNFWLMPKCASNSASLGTICADLKKIPPTFWTALWLLWL